MCAALLSGVEVGVLRYWRPELAQSAGDILIAYRIVSGTGPAAIAKTLARINVVRRNALDQAVGLIDREVQLVVERPEPAGPKLRVFPLIKPFFKKANCAS